MHPRTLRTGALAVLAAFFAACGSSSAPTYSSEIPITGEEDGPAAGAEFLDLLATVPGSPSLEQFLQPVAASGTGDFDFFSTAIAWAAWRLPDGYKVNMAVLNYPARAVGATGAQETRTLSGAVFSPYRKKGKPLSVPIVVYTHGTGLKKSTVASRGITSNGYVKEDGGLEGLIAIHFASVGPAIVAMPDYQGMGLDDEAYHPYVHLQSLAWAGHDMVTAILERLGDTKLIPAGVTWNGKVYVMGYSEGGFAAMAFTREWQAAQRLNGTGFPLDCAVPMAGPHSLSKEMVAVMKEKVNPFPEPFFLPYMLLGYQSVYPEVVKPREAIVPKYFDKGLDIWMSGLYSGGYANARIVEANDGKPVVMGTMLDDAWVKANLDVQTSPVFQAVLANDSIAKPDSARFWQNTMPMYLIHALHDDLVPYANSRDAFDWMAGAPASLSLRTVNWTWVNILGERITFDPGHVGAAPFALAGGFYWLMNGCRE